MGWETRRNGRYFYRKVRIGKRVVSRYMGTGAVGALAAQLVTIGQEHRTARRAALQAVAVEEAGLDLVMNQLGGLCRDLATGGLLEAGCYTHKGQWRRRGDGQATAGDAGEHAAG